MEEDVSYEVNWMFTFNEAIIFTCQLVNQIQNLYKILHIITITYKYSTYK